jgi:hypothetical protein
MLTAAAIIAGVLFGTAGLLIYYCCVVARASRWAG